MSHFSLDLVFSRLAREDLDNLFAWSLELFGEEHFAQFWRSFMDSIRRLADEPLLGRARDDLSPGLRSIPHQSHVIFYRVLPERVHIMRVLHQRQDARGVAMDDLDD